MLSAYLLFELGADNFHILAVKLGCTNKRIFSVKIHLYPALALCFYRK